MRSVRDIETANVLKGLGVEKEIEVTGDPACLLREEETKEIFPSRKSLGFNLAYHSWLGFGHYKNQILNSYSQTMAYFSHNGYKIYYLLHHSLERNIVPELSFKDYEIIDLLPRQQKRFYAGLEAIVTMMLHCGILAFGANTPFLNLAYDQKNLSFAQLIGCPEIAIKPDGISPSLLIGKLEQLLRDKSRYKKIFQREIEKFKENHNQFVNKIKSMITGSR